MKIKAVLFDVIGTTVMEKDPAIINKCFEKSFAKQNIKVAKELLIENRGKDKKEAISIILKQLHYPSKYNPTILESFKNYLIEEIDNFSENLEFREIVDHLISKDIKIGVGTGLPKKVFDKMFDHLRWDELHLDYIGIAEQIGKGRPHPDMIIDMLKKFNVDAAAFLKVGDTVADIQEGKNAGVKTAVILSGTQDEKLLLSQKPDFVINNLTQLMTIV